MRKRSKTTKKLMEFLVLVIIILLINYFFPDTAITESNTNSNTPTVVDTEVDDKVNVTLVKCIDGDTAKILYNEEEVNIRFLAVNTKETDEEYGPEASQYTCTKLTNAKKIEVEFDKESDKYDKYDRLLGWIFIDEELLQLDLIKNGYAEVKYIYGDYKYLNELKEAEKEAKEKSKGIWGL